MLPAMLLEGKPITCLTALSRAYFSTTWGQNTLLFLRRKVRALWIWLIYSPAAEKLAVLFGLCYLLTAAWPTVAGAPAPFGAQLVIVAIMYPLLGYGVYRLCRALTRRVVEGCGVRHKTKGGRQRPPCDNYPYGSKLAMIVSMSSRYFVQVKFANADGQPVRLFANHPNHIKDSLNAIFL